MLTMGKPIELKSAGPVGILGELFGERIRANYEQMRGNITPVEILHFLSAPPELYLAGNEMTTLVNYRNEKKIRNVDLFLVNNVLNRILVYGRIFLTYQDRVFVENILKKLGVADVRRFMRQMRMMKEEIGTVRELLSLYESGRDMVRLIREYRRENGKMEKPQETGAEAEAKAEEKQAAGRLAAAVMNRLQTGKVYREISRYAAWRFGSRTRIDRRELSFGEQHLTAAGLTINDYRSGILTQNQNMVYSGPDRYEVWDISNSEESYGQTAGGFLQTVLLNAARQVFYLRYKEFTGHTAWRHEFTDALHISVRDTLKRLEESSDTFFIPQDREAYRRMEQYFARQEIGTLRKLFAQSAMTAFFAAHDTETVQAPPQYRTVSNRTQVRDAESDITRQEAILPEYEPAQEAKSLRAEWEKTIRTQIEQIERQNRERIERLSEYTRQTKEVPRKRIDREMTKVSALRILTGQEQAGTGYREQEIPHGRETERETEKLREILGEETVRVFETIRGYQEDPGRYPNVTTAEGQAANLLLRDIAAAEERRRVDSGTETETIVYDEAARLKTAESARPLRETVYAAPSAGSGQGTTAKETGHSIELFHRQNGQTLSEERLQELLQTRKKDLRVQNTDVRETVREETQVTEIVQSKVNEMKAKQDEEIARMISQNVKRQLDTLSEKVYGKLERRMDAERRRRGL